jgi:hypothetical protein
MKSLTTRKYRHKGMMVCICLILTQAVFAQSSILERKVLIQPSASTVGAVLKQISDQTGCVFSYAGGVILQEQKVFLHEGQKSVRDVLTQMFGQHVNWVERKNYIVLTKAKQGQIKAAGYVQSKSGEPIANATVYDPVQLKSARTNAYGYYEIKLKTDSIPPLVVRKENFQDTILKYPASKSSLNYVTLEQRDTTIVTQLKAWGDSTILGIQKAGIWLGQRFDNLVEVRNVRDSLHRPFQVSLVPLLGTNGRMAPLVSNTWSLNLIGGLNGGVRGAEIGGVFNLNRGDVRFFQAAGVFNFVKGHTQGAQFAGFTNVVSGTTKGFQAAGFMNVAQGRVDGFQTAGFMNVNASGFRGLSGAGFLNRAGGKSIGLQAAGFMNQGDTVVGMQVSGFLNRAKIMKGVQIGFINVADSLQGVAIGFLSFVRSGYQEVGLHYDELDYMNLQLRTGTHFFYTLLDLGVRMKPVNHLTHFSYGYGIGCSTNHRKPWIWNNDFTIHHYWPGKFVRPQQYLGRWYTGIERSFGRGIAMAIGLTANLQAYEKNGATIELPFSEERILWKENYDNGFSLRTWIGGRVGLRIKF